MAKKNRMAAFAGIGFEIVGLMVGAVLIGQYLDERFNAKGMITAGFVILALTGWLIHVIYMLKSFSGEDKADQ
jgi:MFS-type transporter involved in bile tolerance (Atg22 family)